MLRGTLWPIAVGTGAGIALAVAATRMIASFLFDTTPTDVPTFIVVTAVLISAGGLAAWWPARHAARIDPITTLHAE